MGIVVRAADRSTNQVDVEFLQEFEEGNGFAEIDPNPRFVSSEGKAVFLIFKGTRFSHTVGSHLEGDPIDGAEADGDHQIGGLVTNTADNFAQEAGAVFETASIASRAIETAEELVAQITVAVLDVDEIKSQISSNCCSVYELFNQVVDLKIGKDADFVGAATPLVKNRMMIESDWLKLVLGVWSGKTPRVGELEPDQLIVILAKRFAMGLKEFRSHMADFSLGLFMKPKLIGVCAGSVLNGNGLASPD